MTPEAITDRLAAMTHNVGDLFLDDMGLMLMIVDFKHDPGETPYWICDDTSGQASGYLWYTTNEVSAGKKRLDREKEK